MNENQVKGGKIIIKLLRKLSKKIIGRTAQRDSFKSSTIKMAKKCY